MNQDGVVTDKIPTQFEKRRWERGLELEAAERKRKNLPPRTDGRHKFPWGTSEYEYLPVPPPKPKPKRKPQRKR